MLFPGLGLFFDVHVELKGVRVFFGAVLEGGLLPSDARLTDVGMVSLDVEIVRFLEAEWVGIPCADVKVEIAVLVVFLADAGFEEAVGTVGAGLSFEVFQHVVFRYVTLGVGKED